MYDGYNSTYGNVLTAFVKQPTDYGSVGDSTTFTEEYKGPRASAGTIFSGLAKGDPRSKVMNALGTSKALIWDCPTAPSGTEWVLQDFSLQEQDAGYHCIIRLTWTARKTEDDLRYYVESYNLTWKPYNMSIYGFCKNEPHDDKKFTASPAPETQTAVASHIRQFVEHPYKLALSSLNNYGYYTDSEVALQLNAHETAIAKKVVSGVEFANYHSPVITKVQRTPVLSTSWNSDCPFEPSGIDVIGAPTDIPFTVTAPLGYQTWSYLKTDSRVDLIFEDQFQKNHYWRMTEVWEGKAIWDNNLYGSEGVGQLSGRWKVGNM